MSFRVKLVLYFVCLTLLPLGAAFVGFGAVVENADLRRADARLRFGVHEAADTYSAAVSARAQAAEQLARDREFQRALEARDAATIERLLETRPSLRVESGPRFRVGSPPDAPGVVERRVRVVVGGPEPRRVGSVVAALPLDGALVRRLATSSGLEHTDHLAIVQGGRVVVGPRSVAKTSLRVPAGRSSTVAVRGVEYRALGVSPEAGVTIVALAPASAISSFAETTQRRLLFAFTVSLLLVALVAYVEGRSIVRAVRRVVSAANAIAAGRLDERVEVRGGDELALLARSFNEMAEQLQARIGELEVERRRLRETTTRFGEVLSATHDVDGLMQAIVEAAVEVGGARSGEVVGSQGVRVRTGVPGSRGDRLELPIQAGGETLATLVLVGARFTPQHAEAVSLLVRHAGVALENARLHGILERQAFLDGLTGLGNRRQAEERIREELARAARFGGPVSLVMADLDGFKDVNDRHGHPAGDTVLRAFADSLVHAVREVDLAARWGGEEFVLVLPGTDAEGAVVVAERIRQGFAERAVLLPSGVALRLTASFGVSTCPPLCSVEDFVAAADGALYDAKRSGRNRVAVAERVLGERAAS